MQSPETQFTIACLADALHGSFAGILKQDRERQIDNFGIAWAEILDSALVDVRVIAPPLLDPDQFLLPFMEPHVVTSTLFHVAGGGMRGGPRLDLILQIWLDTEDATGGFGVPLVFEHIPATGPMPELTFQDLRRTAKMLNVATPSGRLMLISHDRRFQVNTPPLDPAQYLLVIGAPMFATLRAPPRPVAGRQARTFFNDLASGWIGDPALAGRERSPVLDELLSVLHVERVLRIHVTRETVEAAA